MKKGQIVNVYQKPLTDGEYEGKAKLIKKLNTMHAPEGFEYWNVKFISDVFEGFKVMRLIKIQ